MTEEEVVAVRAKRMLDARIVMDAGEALEPVLEKPGAWAASQG